MKHNRKFNKRIIPALIICMMFALLLTGCGKKKPAQPIELPVEGASIIELPVEGSSIIELPVENGSGAETSIEAAVEAALEASAQGTEQGTAQGTEQGTAQGTAQGTEQGSQDDNSQANSSQQTDNSSEQAPQAETPANSTTTQEQTQPLIDEDGVYTTKEDVALYIHTYGKLPSNFITKKAARKLGWCGGSLEGYAPGKCIGGDYFGNNEGLLPEDKEYHECDIDTLGKNKRGAKRIIYSDDGYIYYTGDHYESFELLYEP